MQLLKIINVNMDVSITFLIIVVDSFLENNNFVHCELWLTHYKQKCKTTRVTKHPIYSDKSSKITLICA